jgi:hypothetical protein
MTYPVYKSLILSNLQNNNRILNKYHLIYLIMFKEIIMSFVKKHANFLEKRVFNRRTYKVFDSVIDMKSASNITCNFVEEDTNLIMLKLSKLNV